MNVKKRIFGTLALVVCIALLLSVVSAAATSSSTFEKVNAKRKPVTASATAKEFRNTLPSVIAVKKVEKPTEVWKKVTGLNITAEELDRKFEEIPFKFKIEGRFIAWTNDGKNMAYGIYGNHFFKGKVFNISKTSTDLKEKEFIGFYFKGRLIGIYDNEFFIGRYYKHTFIVHSKAMTVRGNFITFPFTPTTTNSY